MSQRAFSSLALALGLSLALLLGSGPARADLATWDQARVTSLAQQLSKATETWQVAVQAMPGDMIGSGEANQEFRLVEKSQELHRRAEVLAGHLSKGEGYAKTKNLYMSLKEIVDDVEMHAERTELGEETMSAWSKCSDLLRQIAPYYDPKADTGA